MGTIRASGTATEFEIGTRTSETVLEALRRYGLPAQEFVLLDSTRRFVSLAHTVGPDETIHAYPVRSADVVPLTPDVAVTLRPSAIAEIFVQSGENPLPGIVQLTRAEAIDYIYNGFRAVLDSYWATHAGCPSIQIALTAGGHSTSRIVGECVGRYQSERPAAAFHAVITANEFEESDEAGVLTPSWALDLTSRSPTTPAARPSAAEGDAALDVARLHHVALDGTGDAVDHAAFAGVQMW